ncbi:MAG: hypothetical protein KGI29_01935 [Pseudomonadota bacterium]|nr:hypothetical protein [Pseudomonadota bacterium]MDE3038046.1 hypothetical protein [Pseudomonadota bacterium]
MNPVVIIVAVLLIVLMVAFGHNPIEDAREDRAAALAGKDPLIEAIDEHNKLQGGVPAMLNNPGYSTVNPYVNQANPGVADHAGLPVYLQQGRQNPYARANPYHSSRPMPASPPPAQNGYYPPPPLSQSSLPPHSDAGMDAVIPYLDLSAHHGVYLRSGQKVGFVGSSVYAIDARGRPKPLPDGKYAMYDGRVTITIRNGRKVVN